MPFFKMMYNAEDNFAKAHRVGDAAGTMASCYFLRDELTGKWFLNLQQEDYQVAEMIELLEYALYLERMYPYTGEQIQNIPLSTMANPIPVHLHPATITGATTIPSFFSQNQWTGFSPVSITIDEVLDTTH